MVDCLAGELSQKEKDNLMAHIKECYNCARLFEDYRDIIERSKSIDITVPGLDVWEKKLTEIKAYRPRHIQIFKPAFALVSLLILVSLFFVRITNNGKEKGVFNSGKNGYGIVLTKLPYPEQIIFERIDYIDEESASEILHIVLDTPTLPLYEY